MPPLITEFEYARRVRHFGHTWAPLAVYLVEMESCEPTKETLVHFKWIVGLLEEYGRSEISSEVMKQKWDDWFKMKTNPFPNQIRDLVRVAGYRTNSPEDADRYEYDILAFLKVPKDLLAERSPCGLKILEMCCVRVGELARNRQQH